MANHFISLETAKQLIGSFKKSKESVLDIKFKGKHVLPESETFDRAAFDSILSKPGCVGIRIYFGMDEEHLVRLVIVPVDAKNQDIFLRSEAQTPTARLASTSTVEGESVDSSSTTDDPGGIIEQGTRCPPSCP